MVLWKWRYRSGGYGFTEQSFFIFFLAFLSPSLFFQEIALI